MNPLKNPYFLRQAALAVGLVALAIGCLMSFTFGLSMSVLHAFGFALLTIAGCIIFPVAGLKRESGQHAIGLFAMGTLFLAIEFFSHIGYSVGTSVMETEQTGAQNAAYEIKQDSAKRNAQQLALYRSDLDKLRSANPWAVSVSADGLRAQIAPMDESIRQEERRGGCGPKCLALQKDKAAIEDKIAVVEKDNQISKQIALLEAEVNKREDQASSAEFKSSRVVAQTSFVAKLATLELEPGKGALTWTQIFVCFFVAIATTFLGPGLLSIAFGPDSWVPGHKSRVAEATEKVTGEAARMLNEMREMMANARPAPVSAPAIPSPEKHTREVVVVEKGDKRLDDLLEGLSHWADKAPALKAA
jgi:hypothetical protein